jgi:hypothetical protein
MEKIVNRLICDAVEGVDKYISNGSIWLIFTDDKKWVIELTKDGTLWYNYNFFKGLFAYTSMDVVENQHYITKWVEDTIINGVKNTSSAKKFNDAFVEDTIINGVKNTTGNTQFPIFYVEDAIENGVRHTMWSNDDDDVEDTIQNGVKHTSGGRNYGPYRVEDTIENGVKDTKNLRVQEITMVQPTIQKIRDIEDTIQNGVKETHSGCDLLINDSIEDVIQNGVKEIHWVEYSNLRSVEDTIKNGVKYTMGEIDYPASFIEATKIGSIYPQKYIENTIENGVKYTGGIGNPNWMGNKVENAIQNGIKETQGCGWSNQGNAENAIKNGVKETHRDAERHPKTVEDAIQNGVKETKKGGFNQHYKMFRTIENGIKETKTPGADGDILSTLEWIKENNTVNIPKLIDDVIEKGIKYTEAAALFDETKVDRIISEGVKETKGGGYLGSIEMKGKMVHQLESPKQNNEVEEVIEHGVKLTNRSLQIDGSCVVEDVIQNGIKETHDDVYHHKGRVGGVIKNGKKI